MTILCFLLEIICLLLERQMVVILPILLERQWRWPSTILSGEPLFYLEPLLIRLLSSLFSGPPPLIRGGAADALQQRLQHRKLVEVFQQRLQLIR